MWQYNELYHHGILGQKWGMRRFQNEDGSLTEAGKQRYRLGKYLALGKTLHDIDKQAAGDLRRIKQEYKRTRSQMKIQNKYDKLKRKYRRIELSQKISGLFGPGGRFLWNISGYALMDRVMAMAAEDRFDKALDKIGDKYRIQYDPVADEYVVLEPTK